MRGQPRLCVNRGMQNDDILRSPLTLPCGAALPSRMAKAAMTEGLADARMNPGIGLERLYRSWSHGGAGLLMTGNVQVDRRVLERPGNVVIDGDEDRDALARWAAAGTHGGNAFWMQLSHAGRQAPFYCSRQPLAPSPVQLRILSSYRRPRALTEAEIEGLIERFVYAAKTAEATGFTGVQIHAAHGYLLSSFLSPLVNRRSDAWGGSLANRARLLLDTARAVRQAVAPGFAVGVKLNSADFQKGGFSSAECLQVVRWLNDLRIDLLEISGGNYEQPRLLGFEGRHDAAEAPRGASTREREAYFIEYAAQVRAVAAMPVMLTGGFRSRAAMTAALEAGDTDLIGLGRPLCVDTQFVARLFERSVDRAEDPAANLTYGRGDLGPGSRLFAVKFVNIFSRMGWYYAQLFRLGRGEAPDWRLGLAKALFIHLKAELTQARAIRAFQKKARPLDTRASADSRLS